MNEIEKVSKKLNTVSELLQQNISIVDSLIDEVAALKKADEIKPVFPDDLDCHWLHVDDIETAHDYGLTAGSDEKCSEIESWLEARKYIIETINKANKGDNGFKPETANYYVYRERDTLSAYYDWNSDEKIQKFEDKLYIRTSKEAARLVDDKEFTRNLDIYLN